MSGKALARSGEQVASTAATQVIPVCMGDDRGLHRSAGIDVKVTGRAIQAALGPCHQRGGDACRVCTAERRGGGAHEAAPNSSLRTAGNGVWVEEREWCSRESRLMRGSTAMAINVQPTPTKPSSLKRCV